MINLTNQRATESTKAHVFFLQATNKSKICYWQQKLRITKLVDHHCHARLTKTNNFSTLAYYICALISRKARANENISSN